MCVGCDGGGGQADLAVHFDLKQCNQEMHFLRFEAVSFGCFFFSFVDLALAMILSNSQLSILCATPFCSKLDHKIVCVCVCVCG